MRVFYSNYYVAKVTRLLRVTVGDDYSMSGK